MKTFKWKTVNSKMEGTCKEEDHASETAANDHEAGKDRIP